MKRTPKVEQDDLEPDPFITASVDEIMTSLLPKVRPDLPWSIAQIEKAASNVHEIEQNWFVASSKVSLPLLVQTTVALRKDYPSDSHAADAALRLIDTCSRLLAHNKRRKEFEIYQKEQVEALGLHPEAYVEYRRAIKLITCQERPERAEEDFLSFVEADVRINAGLDGAKAKEEVKNRIGLYERVGFLPADLLRARVTFALFRRMRLLGKKRRPEKKALAGKQAGKVARNEKKTDTA